MNARFDPRIRHLQVLVNGHPVAAVPQRLIVGLGVRVELPPGTEAVEVTYEASGVVARSEPSTSGRALVLATPLSMSGPSMRSATLVLHGSQILNIGCWRSVSLPKACGERRGHAWTVNTAAGAFGVVAQVDLPTHPST